MERHPSRKPIAFTPSIEEPTAAESDNESELDVEPFDVTLELSHPTPESGRSSQSDNVSRRTIALVL
jgi:hypothetical protein